MADWISPEAFDKTEYGRLNKQPGAHKDFRMEFKREDVPPGGRVVSDPKDGTYGIIVDADGTAICKVVLKPMRREQG